MEDLSRRARRVGAETLCDEIQISLAQFEVTRHGDAKGARKRLAETRARIVARDDRSLLCWVYVMSVWPSNILGYHEEALDFADRGVALAETTPQELPFALQARAFVLHDMGRIAEAIESCRAGLAALGTDQDNSRRTALLRMLGDCLMSDGDEASGIAAYETAITVASRNGWLESEGVGRANLGWKLIGLGRNEQAESHFRLAIDRYHHTNRGDAAVRIGLAIALASRGELVAARAVIAEIEPQNTLRPQSTTLAMLLVQAWCAAALNENEAWPEAFDDHIAAQGIDFEPLTIVARRVVEASHEAGWVERAEVVEQWLARAEVPLIRNRDG